MDAKASTGSSAGPRRVCLPLTLDALGGEPFSTVLTDPPWKYKLRSEKGITSRSPEAHYPTMTIAEMGALPVESVMARDASMWMWVPGPFLAAGLHVPLMRSWGFEPSSIALVWIKTNSSVLTGRLVRFGDDIFRMNLGFTTRQNAEFVVLGRRGNPERKSKAIRQIMSAPWPEPIFQHQLEHSRKPFETHRRIEAYADGPRLEMFSREHVSGWTAWGNDTELFQ